jgi:hypothetical protein
MTLEERKKELMEELNRKTAETIELQGRLKEIDRLILLSKETK